MAEAKRSVLIYNARGRGEDLLFAPEERALFVDQIWQAIENSATFGEFRRKLPAGEWEKMVERARESFEEDEGEYEIPKDDDPFDCTWIPGLEDGDYPPWIQQEMLSWFPRDIAQRFGSESFSFVSGDCLVLPINAEREIVDALKDKGFLVKRRDELWLDWRPTSETPDTSGPKKGLEEKLYEIIKLSGVDSPERREGARSLVEIFSGKTKPVKR